MSELQVYVTTWVAFLDRIPENPWSPEFLWKIINHLLDPWWWKYKAVCFGIAAFSFMFWPLSSMTPWVRRSRIFCSIGSAVIAASLANPGLGPIGDVIFATGFVMASLIMAYCGVLERKELAKEKLPVVYPEKLIYQWVTNQIFGAKKN